MNTVQVTVNIADDVGLDKLINHMSSLAFAHDYLLSVKCENGRIVLTMTDQPDFFTVRRSNIVEFPPCA